MNKALQFIQNLSLDITIGSVVMTLFVGEILEVKVTLNMAFGLAIAIWLIYTADHLLDAYKSKGSVTNPRHAFHSKYFKFIISIALLVFSLGLVNLTQLPESTIWIGGILALISLVYLLYSYFSKKAINKELFAAIVYAVGICVAPLSLLDEIGIESISLMIILSLVAYGNLLIISVFEEKLDRNDKVKSVAIRKETSGTLKLIHVVLILAFISSVIMLITNGLDHAYTLLIVMIAVLFLTIRYRSNFINQYRLICDGIFLIPLIYLF